MVAPVVKPGPAAMRHVIALTNSTKSADIIEAAVRQDFPDSMERRIVRVGGQYGLCFEISVDADEYDHWIK
jgi:hypothetical protein